MAEAVLNEAARENAGRAERLRLAEAMPGLELAEVFLAEAAYSSHRHDTYAVGLTVSGVQRFDYRGVQHRSGPGDAFVLHPDELHDGRPGTDTGFGYRTLYVAPELIGGCLNGALPFVSHPVCGKGPLQAAIVSALTALEPVPDELHETDVVSCLAHALAAASGKPNQTMRSIDSRAMERVRDHLRNAARSHVGIAELEREAGLNRWTLYRQFRAAFGVSPHRYRTMRRLDLARHCIAGGMPLAEAAAASGFADQSHMTRRFRQTFGLSPGLWQRLSVQPVSRSFNSSMRSVPQNSSPS